MSTTTKRGAAALAFLLLIAACGDDDSAQLPPAGDDTVAGTCLEGTTDCTDTPFAPGEPQDGVSPDQPPTDLPPAGGSMSVSEAVAAGDTGLTTVFHGFYVDSGSGPMLCEALAESFPPQCGGASLPMSDASVLDPDAIQTNQGTSWSEAEVIVMGQIVGGVLIPTPIAG